jgi:hypothetical protein
LLNVRCLSASTSFSSTSKPFFHQSRKKHEKKKVATFSSSRLVHQLASNVGADCTHVVTDILEQSSKCFDTKAEKYHLPALLTFWLEKTDRRPARTIHKGEETPQQHLQF